MSRADDPISPVLGALTEEAAYARRLLHVAGAGPANTASMAVDVMLTMINHGFRNSVAWYLAPSPGDDIRELIFSRRGADNDPSESRWRDRRELVEVLGDAQGAARSSDVVEVWSGNGHGLRRCALRGDGRELLFLPPEAEHFRGDDSLVLEAVVAWGSWAAGEDEGPALDGVAAFDQAQAEPVHTRSDIEVAELLSRVVSESVDTSVRALLPSILAAITTRAAIASAALQAETEKAVAMRNEALAAAAPAPAAPHPAAPPVEPPPVEPPLNQPVAESTRAHPAAAAAPTPGPIAQSAHLPNATLGSPMASLMETRALRAMRRAAKLASEFRSDLF